jgi:hypothetical protein
MELNAMQPSMNSQVSPQTTAVINIFHSLEDKNLSKDVKDLMLVDMQPEKK